MMTNSNSKLTKKDLNAAFWRWSTQCQICWNYETMQSGGVVLALGPALRKIYKNDVDFIKALDSHFSFFNTQPFMGNIIMGATLALEEHSDELSFEESRQAVSSIKTGLMGPLAGTGDAIFFVVPFTIFGALSAYMALTGSPYGLLFGIAFGLSLLIVRKKLFHLGYEQGSKFVTTLAGQLKSLTNSANILGMMVIGALIASTVNVTIPFTFTQGEVQVGLQTALDMVMPKLVPALLVGFIYWLLGKKKMTSTKVILVVLGISLLAYNLKIFG